MKWPSNLLGNPAYAAMVLGAISEGRYEHTFVPLVLEAGDHTAIVQVSQDALKIDGVRVNVSAALQQQVADLLGAHLLTPRLLDQMWAQRAVTLTPCTESDLVVAGKMSTAEAMIAHSMCVDAKLAKAGGLPPGGIVQTVGKTWVVTNKLLEHPGKACNMGWHLERPLGAPVPFDPAPTLSGAHMVQSPGYHHDAGWIDYSQNAVFALEHGSSVDGKSVAFSEIAKNPAFASLVNGDGILKVLRQPGVAEMVARPLSQADVLPGGATVVITALGAGIGASLGGGPGALVGGRGRLDARRDPAQAPGVNEKKPLLPVLRFPWKQPRLPILAEPPQVRIQGPVDGTLFPSIDQSKVN